MADLPLADVTLHYEVQGSGPPMVLLSGIASDSGAWGSLPALLAKELTVIRPDNRASGRTMPLLPEVSIPLCAGDMARLIEHLALGPAHLVGHSMGGLIAMELAAQRPDLARSVTLIANAPLRSGRNQHLLETLVQLRGTGMDQRLWLRAFYPWLLRPQLFQVPGLIEVAMRAALAYPHAQRPEQFAAQVAAVGMHDPLPPAKALACELQAVLGAQDLLYPVAETRAALRASFPGLTITEIDGAAHSPQLDAPEAVSAAILGFVLGKGAPL